MPYDFAADAALIIKEFANANVLVDSETIRGIYDAPSRPVPSFDLAVVSSAPSLVLSWDKVNELGIDSQFPVTVIPDSTKAGINYLVSGPVLHDGAGLASVTLEEA